MPKKSKEEEVPKKKKEEEVPTREDILNRLHRSNAHNDEIIFVPANQFFNVHEVKLDTGIFPLNLELGGGYPCGQNILLYGEPNVGKDMVINFALAALQRNKGQEATAAFIYNEGEFDKGFARLLGCKLDWSTREIELLEERTQRKISPTEKRKMRSEGIGEAQFYSASTAQAAMDLILKLSEAGVYDMIVLNSVDGLLLAESVEGVDKEGGIQGATKGRGGQRRAALLSDFFRFKSHLMQEPMRIMVGKKILNEKRRTVCFFISQLRMASVAPNVFADKQQTGGWALKHYSGLTINLSRVLGKETFIGAEAKKSGDHIETSHLINFEIKKAKYGSSDGGNLQVRYYKKDHPVGEKIIKAGTLDITQSVRTALLDSPWVAKSGRGYLLSFPGQEAILLTGGRMVIDAFLEDNPEICLLAQKLLTERLHVAVEEKQEDVPDVGKESSGEVREDDEGERE